MLLFEHIINSIPPEKAVLSDLLVWLPDFTLALVKTHTLESQHMFEESGERERSFTIERKISSLTFRYQLDESAA